MAPTALRPRLPFTRPDVLTVPPHLLELQATAPVVRVQTPVGDEGWLITRHADVKRLLSDGSLCRSHRQPDKAARYSRSALEGGPLGEDPDAEDADYGKMRRLLSPAFSPRRMRSIHADISTLVNELFDELLSRPRPVDFHDVLAYPLPVMVTCRLLGIPADDRDQFRAWFEATTALYDEKRAADGFAALTDYMRTLIQVKKREPGEDLVSDLIAHDDEMLTLDYLAIMVAGLLYAAHETTVERLDHGTIHLLSHQEQREAIRRDPQLMASAIEEILRVAAPSRPPRVLYARRDFEVGGQPVRTGELVMLSIAAANHDPAVFPDPLRFDLTRPANMHLSFGYGSHFCLGAAMARIEMELVFARLVNIEPELRLALSPQKLLQHENPASGGMDSLLLTWG